MIKRVWLLLLLLLGAVFGQSNRPSLLANSSGLASVFLPLLQTAPQLQVTPYLSGFINPTDLTFLPDGRLLVSERAGIIYLVTADGQKLETPFLDISAIVANSGWEQGLLGIVIHPQLPFLYLTYAALDGDFILARFTLSTDDPYLADPNSQQILLEANHHDIVHYGGDLAFGADGYLYVSVGDGGYGEEESRAMNLGYFLGKLLRLDVSDPKLLYQIPSDNPFVQDPNARPEIWAMGLRNPWRFSFDRLTGEMFIGDVGEGNWEEVNWQSASTSGGQNYGWPCYEATMPLNLADCDPPENYILPIFSYDHTNSHCAITGGFVYRGNNYPALAGKYLFTDFCNGDSWVAWQDLPNHWLSYSIGHLGAGMVAYAENSLGELYIANVYDGTIYALTFSE